MTDLAYDPPARVVLPVVGAGGFPVRRVYCVGRNYAEHAREMGHDPDREPPFFFQKNPDDLNQTGRLPYPSRTADLHHEVELAVLVGPGLGVFGYAVALDMTRPDLQADAKKAGRPWAAAKAFALSAPIGPAVPAAALPDPAAAGIRLAVNGTLRQQARIADMIWSVPEILAALADLFVLAPGDVILSGTPAGVGPVRPGDVLDAGIDGLPPLRVAVE